MSKTTITIQGHQFDAELPYAEGHVLTQPEANALNQTFAENVRNNFATKVKAKIEAAEKERGEGAELSEDEIAGLRDEFATYASEYKFQGRRAPAAPIDPVGREAAKLARAQIVAALAKHNQTVKDLKEGELERYIEIVAAKPAIRAEAEERVKALQRAANETINLEELSALAATPVEPAAAAE